MIEHWRQAWSARDIDQYVASYTDNFAPADGGCRAAWAEGAAEELREPRQHCGERPRTDCRS